jgi:hypothetical protein
VIGPALALAVAFACVMLLQCLAPPAIGSPNPIWSQTHDLLDVRVNPRVSTSAISPLVSLGPAIAIFLSFVAAFLVSTQRSGAWLIMKVAAFAAAFYALWALGDLLAASGRSLLSQNAVSLDPLNMPFPNRNHAASYYGAGAILWLLVLLSDVQAKIGRAELTLAELPSAILGEGSAKLIAATAGFLLCITAAFMTLSRAGVLLSLGTLVLTLAIFAYRWLRGHPKLPLITALSLVLGVVFVEVWGGRLGFRIGTEGLTDIGRGQAYLSTLAIIRDFPVLGTGFGTFAQVFPEYRSALVSINRTWDWAHSTPLEIAAELGLPFMALLVLFWFYCVILLLRGVFLRNRDAVLPLAGFAIVLLGTLHSSVDFPLQIPGYAIVWAALAGMGLAQCFGSRPAPVAISARPETRASGGRSAQHQATSSNQRLSIRRGGWH